MLIEITGYSFIPYQMVLAEIIELTQCMIILCFLIQKHNKNMLFLILFLLLVSFIWISTF